VTTFLLFLIVVLLAIIAQQLVEANRRLTNIEERQLRQIIRRLDNLGAPEDR
jgi:hypothetical protein